MNNIEKIQNIRIKYIAKRLFDYRIDQELCAFIGLSNFGNILNDNVYLGGMALCAVAIINDIIHIKKESDLLVCELWNYEDSKYGKKYYELREKYYLYIRRLALYFKRLNLEDPLDIGLYFSNMLHSGDLSITNNFKYKLIKKDKDCKYPGILGSRIISGYGVCRNMSALLTDLYKELGYDAYDLHVNYKSSVINPKHAVVLVKDVRGNFIIDPTWRTVASIDDKLLKSKVVMKYNGEKLRKRKQYYIAYYEDKGYINIIGDNFFKDGNPNREFDINDLNERNKHIHREFMKTRFYDPDSDLTHKFKDDNLDLMKEISELEQSLTLPKVKKKTK